MTDTELSAIEAAAKAASPGQRREEKDIYQPLSFHPGMCRLRWTQEKPTVEGMYWCRCIDPCRRIAGPANIMYYTPGCTLIEMYDEFAGPIPEPEE